LLLPQHSLFGQKWVLAKVMVLKQIPTQLPWVRHKGYANDARAVVSIFTIIVIVIHIC
jgi:hypothetical protein